MTSQTALQWLMYKNRLNRFTFFFGWKLFKPKYYWWRVCVCVFFPFHCKGFSWLGKTIKVKFEFSSAMLFQGNISISSTFVSASKTIIERTLALAIVQANECQLNCAKPREVKDNFYNFLESVVKVRSIATFLLTKLGSRSDSAQG